MAKESTADCTFVGEYAAELKALYELIVRLWQDHRTSPHRAGDELIYSFGSLDYVVVINQDVLGGLVEVKTKDGNVDCLMDAEGNVSCKLNTDPKEGGREGADIRLILQNTVKALGLYYLRRA